MEDKEGIKLQDRIDDYILGRMTAVERADFEREAASDPEKLERLNFTRSVRQAFASRQQKLDLFKQMELKAEMEEYVTPAASAPVACASYPVDAAAFASSADDCAASPASPEPEMPRVKPYKKALRWGVGIAAVLLLGFFVYMPMADVADGPEPGASYDINRGEPSLKKTLKIEESSSECAPCEEISPASGLEYFDDYAPAAYDACPATEAEELELIEAKEDSIRNAARNEAERLNDR